MISEKQVSANLRAFYLSRIDWIALCIVAVIDIWTRHGLNLAEILLLQAIFGFGIMILEYPSGLLADLTSRRILLIMVYVCNIIALLMFLVADNFVLFTVVEILFAFSLASKSGADTAHIYDTYLEIGDQDRADEVLATGKSMTFASIMVMTAVGGILSSIDWRLTFIIGSIGFALSGLSYLVSVEPNRNRLETSAEAMKLSWGYLKDLGIIKLALIMMFVNVSLRISFWDYIPRLELLDVDTYWFGIVLAAANGVALITSLIIRKYRQLVDHDLIILGIGIAGLLLFLNLNSLVVVLVAILFHQIYRGAANLIFEIKLNQKIDSSVRASIKSLISAVIQGLYFLLIVIMNILALSSYFIHVLNFAMGLSIGILILGISLKIQSGTRSKAPNSPQIDALQDSSSVIEVTVE